MPELSAIPWAVRKPRNKRPHLPWDTVKNSKKPDSPSPSQAAQVADRKQVGASAEQMARRELEAQGLVWVCSNFRCKVGEIDLIMRHGTLAVVVEVRKRSNARHGKALESIGHHKRRKISKAALYWWTVLGQRHFSGVRFDAVGLDEADSTLTWVKNAWMLD
jgi:putative endonuclease